MTGFSIAFGKRERKTQTIDRQYLKLSTPRLIAMHHCTCAHSTMYIRTYGENCYDKPMDWKDTASVDISYL